MSLAAVTWALTSAPVENAQEHVILIALADRANDDGTSAWPSQSWLAHRGRCSTRTVRRHLQAMEDRGLILRGDQQYVAHLRADSRPIVWDLDMSQTDQQPEPTQLPAQRPAPRQDNLSGRAPTGPQDNLSGRAPTGPQDNLSGRSTEAERPDNSVRSGRTLLSYKPSLDPSLEPPNNNPREQRPSRQCDSAPRSSSSETAKNRQPNGQSIADLESAIHAAGIPASFGRMHARSRSQVIAAITTHGIPALVEAAKRSHRPDSPTRHVHGLLPAWMAMPAPAAPACGTRTELCGDCDHGWLEDDADGRAVKCPCRTRNAGSAR